MSSDKMLLDDALKILRRAMPVPNPFRVDHGDWSCDANAQALRLGAQDMALGRKER